MMVLVLVQKKLGLVVGANVTGEAKEEASAVKVPGVGVSDPQPAVLDAKAGIRWSAPPVVYPEGQPTRPQLDLPAHGPIVKDLTGRFEAAAKQSSSSEPPVPFFRGSSKDLSLIHI